MSATKIAQRYARAVFDLANENNAVAQVARELRSVADCMSGSSELSAVLTDPRVAPDARKGLMAAIVARLGVSDTVRKAILLIAEKRRAKLIPDIAREFERLADDREGRVRAEVTSAQALTDAQAARLSAILEKVTGRKITLTRKVDPALVGGVITRIGDRVYDGSVNSRIAEIRQALLS